MTPQRMLLAGALAGLFTAGCHVDMWQQPRVNPLSRSDFHADEAGSRPVVEGTVAQGREDFTDSFHTGLEGGKPIADIPESVARTHFASKAAMLDRGQDRYTVYCTPCHGTFGDGNGFIALRGLGYWQKLPAKFKQPRLVDAKDGYLFGVISKGKGAMYGYAARIPDPADRWAIVSYLRVLQKAELTAAAVEDEPAAGEGEHH
ncbi:MAG: c-type cytochrome [Armatimonadota bacterium]